jgi:hypothetical protein
MVQRIIVDGGGCRPPLAGRRHWDTVRVEPWQSVSDIGAFEYVSATSGWTR